MSNDQHLDNIIVQADVQGCVNATPNHSVVLTSVHTFSKHVDKHILVCYHEFVKHVSNNKTRSAMSNPGRTRPNVPDALLKNVLIPVKVTQSIKDKLDAYCVTHGLTVSEVIRMAIAEKVNDK